MHVQATDERAKAAFHNRVLWVGWLYNRLESANILQKQEQTLEDGEFMKALEDAPRATMTKVVMRQLVIHGFDINHPLLDLQHYLGYPATLEWNNDKVFTSGLKSLREVVLGQRESRPLAHLFSDCERQPDVGRDSAVDRQYRNQ